MITNAATRFLICCSFLCCCAEQVRGDDRDTLIVPSLTVKKGLGFADLTSVTGYVDRRVLRHADGTYFNSAAIAGFFLDTVGAPPYSLHQAENDNILGNIASPVTFNDHFNTWTQEFRLSHCLVRDLRRLSPV